METLINHQVLAPAKGGNSTVPNGESYASPSYYVAASTALALALVLISCFSRTSSKSTLLPWVNRPGTFDVFRVGAKYRFLKGARDMVKKGFEDYGNSPGFRMVADGGEIVMLSPKFAAELKNDHRVDFDFHEGIPGFDFTQQGARDAKILREVTKSQLTHHLSKITDLLSSECNASMQRIFTDNEEYHDIELRSSLLDFISRISSKAFLGGDPLCQNEEWLKITTTYAGTVNKAAVMLRLWPRPLHRFVHWFLPSCREARTQVRLARRLFEPMIERRRRAKAEDPSVQFDDTVEWAEKAAKGLPYDASAVQLLFSMAAMHTTTDLLTQIILDLAAHSEIVATLRQEIETVLREEGGWTKAAMHKMKLLDSVLKECQRVKPAAISGLRGILNADLTLSDGTHLEKGTSIAVSSHLHWDDATYKNPQQWDGWRFYNLRKTPGKEHSSQLVSTCPEHMGFGIGTHACPGRFFGSHEVKIALCHFLLQYDWKLAEGALPQTRTFMWSLVADPMARISVKRRYM
ncbi:Dihydromonacolin L monooxygenase LovA 11 [Colletotrichum chlorophyti]|uniref:Dihydromonacolin L monooxygenase LovA 11 n=1 Tax=Colletotrichum chlorophyti TaxID=708187 RepID=A0A1Q8S9A6_9PEZI|nr:Dihydromonacolin L monooxygenase LovA 11 [Colletotrichum chlorophyti]